MKTTFTIIIFIIFNFSRVLVGKSLTDALVESDLVAIVNTDKILGADDTIGSRVITLNVERLLIVSNDLNDVRPDDAINVLRRGAGHDNNYFDYSKYLVFLKVLGNEIVKKNLGLSDGIYFETFGGGLQPLLLDPYSVADSPLIYTTPIRENDGMMKSLVKIQKMQLDQIGAPSAENVLKVIEIYKTMHALTTEEDKIEYLSKISKEYENSVYARQEIARMMEVADGTWERVRDPRALPW